MKPGPVSPLWLFALILAIFVAFGFALYFVGENGGTAGTNGNLINLAADESTTNP